MGFIEFFPTHSQPSQLSQLYREVLNFCPAAAPPFAAAPPSAAGPASAATPPYAAASLSAPDFRSASPSTIAHPFAAASPSGVGFPSAAAPPFAAAPTSAVVLPYHTRPLRLNWAPENVHC